jgi:Na+-transporting methylmalonyl-CoA/oxaloacetate decarboxylase gamma subunit
MSNLTFGITLLLVGMGGTLLTLWLLTLLIRGLTTLLPPPPPDAVAPKSKP